MNANLECAFSERIYVLLPHKQLDDATRESLVAEIYFLYCKQFQIIILQQIKSTEGLELATQLSKLGLPIEILSTPPRVANGKIKVPEYRGHISFLSLNEHLEGAWSTPKDIFEDWNVSDAFSKVFNDTKWSLRKTKTQSRAPNLEPERTSQISQLLNKLANPPQIASDTLIIDESTHLPLADIGKAINEGRNIVSVNCNFGGLQFLELLHRATISGATLNFNASIGGSAPIMEVIKRARNQSRIECAEFVIDTSIARIILPPLQPKLESTYREEISQVSAARKLSIQTQFDILSFAVFGKTLPEIDLVAAYQSEAQTLLNNRSQRRTKEVLRMENTAFGPKASLEFRSEFHHSRMDSLSETNTGVCVTLEDGSTWFASGTDANPIAHNISLLAQFVINDL